MLTHANLRSNAETLVETWRFTTDDVLIHALPIFHTHGLFVATNVILMAGAAMILLPKFDPAEAIALFPQATALMGVPTFYTRLLDRAGADARGGGGHAPLHLRLGAASRRDAPRSSTSAPATPSWNATA